MIFMQNRELFRPVFQEKDTLFQPDILSARRTELPSDCCNHEGFEL